MTPENTVLVADLKRNVCYYLTADFTPYGGTEVKLKHIQQKDDASGRKGDAIMVDSEGHMYRVSRKGYLFTKYPL